MKWKITIEAIFITCLAMIIIAGCATRQSITRQTATEDAQTNVYRTDTVLLHDTTSVRQSSRTEVIQKDTTVQIELPQIQIERESMMDTTSIIDTPYFTSKATWSGGKLTHTFKTKPGASIKAKVRVTDTSMEQSTTTERTHSMKEVSKRDSIKTTTNTNTKTGTQAPAKKDDSTKVKGMPRALKIVIAAALILLTIAAALLYFTKGSGIFKRRR